jgi:hypothetical protein
MSAATCITVRVPLAIRRRRGRKVVVMAHGGAAAEQIPTGANPATVKALARAFRWKRMLEDGRYASISEIAAAEKIDRGFVGSILRLTLLAPDIILKRSWTGGSQRGWACPHCSSHFRLSGIDSGSNGSSLLSDRRE